MVRIISALGLVFATALAYAQPHLDQEQVNIDSSLTFSLGGSSEQKLAQVFTAGRSGFISHLAFPMGCQPNATIAVQIEETTAGIPNGVVLEREEVPGTIFTSHPTPAIGFRLVQFRHPVRVTNGIQYAITLEASGGECGMYAGPAGDTYAGGAAYFDARPNAAGWIELFSPTRDLAFQIFTTARRSGR